MIVLPMLRSAEAVRCQAGAHAIAGSGLCGAA